MIERPARHGERSLIAAVAQGCVMQDREGRPLDVVALTDLQVDCVVGVYGPEREVPQRLCIDVELYLTPRAAAGGLETTVDYARLAGDLRFILDACRFRLLENAAEAMARYILLAPTADAPRAQVQAVTLRLRKPQALGGLAVPGIRIHRQASDCVIPSERRGDMTIETVFLSSGQGIYRVCLAPGASIPPRSLRHTEEQELILGRGLLVQGQPAVRGTALRWPLQWPRAYANPGSTGQSLLRICRPCWSPEDEVPGDSGDAPPPSAMQLIEGRRYYPADDDGIR